MNIWVHLNQIFQDATSSIVAQKAIVQPLARQEHQAQGGAVCQHD